MAGCFATDIEVKQFWCWVVLGWVLIIEVLLDTMYNFEELKPALKVWKNAINGYAEKLNIPENLLLTQTCGWPLVTGEKGCYKVVGVPEYNVAGCDNNLYSSTLIVPKSSPIKTMTDLQGKTMAINALTSCSGLLLPAVELGPELFSSLEEVMTGSHLQSLLKVGCGEVDVAGIDCVSYAYIENHRPQNTKGVRILRNTLKFPALPYVTTSEVNQTDMERLRKAMKMALNCNDQKVVEARNTLMIKGFNFNEDEISCQVYQDHVLTLYKEITSHNLPNNRLVTNGEDGMRDFLLSNRPNDIKDILRAVKILQNNVIGAEKCQELCLPDTSFVRITFPNGPRDPWLETLSPRNCVIFFGRKPRVHMLTLDHNDIASFCNSTDMFMSRILDPNIIEAYLSMQIAPGGNYMNLVVFREGKSGEDFKSVSIPIHADAIRDVASKYYDRVWIHRCEISPKNVSLLQTIALEYERGKKMFRKVYHWNK